MAAKKPQATGKKTVKKASQRKPRANSSVTKSKVNKVVDLNPEDEFDMIEVPSAIAKKLNENFDMYQQNMKDVQQIQDQIKKLNQAANQKAQIARDAYQVGVGLIQSVLIDAGQEDFDKWLYDDKIMKMKRAKTN